MSDEHPTQPLPESRAQWVLSTDAGAPASAPGAPTRRRRWPWLVALLAVAALVVGAWFAGEYIARGIVERTIRDQLITHLDLPVDQQIDVDIPGQILPQLISGRLDSLTVSSADVPFRGLSGDVVVRATGIPVLRNGTMFELPGLDQVEEVVVNKEVAEGRATPLFIYGERPAEQTSA